MNFFISSPPQDTITLSPKQHHHAKVRRLSITDHICFLNGQGDIYHAQITHIDHKKTLCSVINHTHHPRPSDTHLYIALCRGQTMEEICQKAVEIGITHIHPVITDFIGGNMPKKSWEKKSHRLIEIMQAALCQSGNPYLPQIMPLTNFKECLSNSLVVADTVASEKAYHGQPIFIGPEGGFSPTERADLLSQNIPTIQLPGHILRSETAAIIAMGMMVSARSCD